MSFVAIQDFCQTGSGGTPSRAKADRYYGGAIPWVRSGELREGVITETGETITPEALEESSAKLVPSGALLVAMYGATIGRVAELGVDAATNQAVCHILPKEGTADRRYMFHALCSKAAEWVGKGAGGAQPNISQGIIKETKIYLPPLPEQKRIAAILDKADEVRRKRAETIRLTEELLKSAFLEMFGDPVTNPKGWEVKKLGEVVDEIYRYPSYYGIEYVDEGVPEVRGELIGKDGIVSANPDGLRFISEATSKRFPKTTLLTGDLVMSVRGTVGKVGIVPAALKGANMTANLLRISPNRSVLDEVYFWSLLRSEFFQRHLLGASSTTTIATIRVPDIKAAALPVPPLELQQKFRVFAAKAKELKEQCSSHDHLPLNASLTQRAFRGEL